METLAEIHCCKRKLRKRTDVGNSGRDADFDTRVSLFSQLSLEELVQLGIENTICDELSPLRYSCSLSCSHLGNIIALIRI